MKRLLCLMLALLSLTCFSACHYGERSDILEPVEFIYPRRSDFYAYGAEDGIFASELREGSGHMGDLNYLISIYLRGPQDETLHSPFPEGCKAEVVRYEDQTVYLVLSSEFAALENVDLTLACASLARTCFSLTDAQQVHIESSANGKTIRITLEPGNLLMADYVTFEPDSSEE